MEFLEAVNLVIGITHRRDKLAETKQAINRAITFMAASGTFAHDLVELQLPIDSTLYAQSFAINASPFARFRKIKYIRPTGFKRYLTHKDPSRVFQEGCEQLNTFYRAGSNIVFKLSSLQSTLEIGYYQYHAALVADDATDWMMDEMWPALHDLACSYVFGDIGNTDEADRYFKLAMTQYRVFQNDLGDGVSRG